MWVRRRLGGRRAIALSFPPEVGDLGRLPDDLPLGEWGKVYKLRISRGFLGAEATSKMGIVEAFPPIYRQVLDAGYEVLSADNEGFEAELFFARGAKTTGTLLLREGPCKGEITIRLIYGDKRYR